MQNPATMDDPVASPNALSAPLISVAPMMDYTDRHCRYFMRLLSPSAVLYTEMINAAAIVRGAAGRLLQYDAAEHPVVLQLGGSDPTELAAAARVGESFGYRQINLNCGCPSERVKSGNFGACLMADPERVADCVTSMRESVGIPVTVKCRIAIEPCDFDGGEYDFLLRFVTTVAAAGCKVFVVHARTAVLSGLSPKQNREIPPLRYEVVRRLRTDLPNLVFVLNGGIRTSREVAEHLCSFDGVMIGREAYQNPYWLAELHRNICDPNWEPPTREAVVAKYSAYLQAQIETGANVSVAVRHVQGLYAGLPGARAWRRFVGERCIAGGQPQLLLESLRIVQQAA